MLPETNVTLYDVLENLEEASIPQLEIALTMARMVREPFMVPSMSGAADVWTKIINALESEILERTLLK